VSALEEGVIFLDKELNDNLGRKLYIRKIEVLILDGDMWCVQVEYRKVFAWVLKWCRILRSSISRALIKIITEYKPEGVRVIFDLDGYILEVGDG